MGDPPRHELQVTCPQCGIVQAATARFCAQCGASLEGLLPVPGFDASLLATSDLTGRTLAGKYRLVTKVGEGGMGTVYKAEHTLLGRLVAIKVLHPDMLYDESAVARFKGEARAASRLNHPHVISVMDFGQTPDGLFFLVTEFLHGLPLSQILAEGKGLGAQFAYLVLTQALEGMQEAHNLGIVHRDLKPENIFLERFRDGSLMVKVLDFGVAKDLEAEGPGLTSPGMVCGTPEYMSPEQAMGKPVDPRTDVYALGIVFYEMLAGANPFERSSPAESMIAHVRDPAPRLSSVAPNLPRADVLDTIIGKAIAKEPSQRYENAGSFLKALKAWGENAALDVTDQTDLAGLEWPEDLAANHEAATPARIPRRPKSTKRGSLVDNRGTEAILALLEGESPGRLRIEDDAGAGVAPSSLRVVPDAEPELSSKATKLISSPSGETGLVGRERLLAEILDALTVVGQARIVGPAGMGKTAVLDALADHWQGKGWKVYSLRPTSFVMPPAPLAPIRRLLSEISRNASHTWEKLPTLDQGVLEPIIETGIPIAGRQTGAALREMESSWIALLGAMAETTILLVDDIGSLDAPSRRMVEIAKDAIQRGRLSCSMAVTCQGPAPGDESPLFELPPLSLSQARSLAHRLLAGLGSPPELLDDFYMTEAASGNPFYVAQAVRAEMEGSFPTRAVASPLDILDARLSSLSNSERWVLQVACLIDEACREEDLAFVLDELLREWDTKRDKQESLGQCLENLEHKNLLIRDGNQWRAAHEIIAQAVVNLAPVEFRRKTNEILARRFIGLVKAPPSIETYLAASHVLAAETQEPAALSLCLQAGTVAELSGDHRDASRHLGFVLDRLHRRWAQGGIGDKGLVGDIANTARALASCLVSAGEEQAAQAVLGETLVVVRSEGLDHLTAGILMDMAQRDLAMGQVESGVNELAEALDLVAGRHWYLDALVSVRLAELLARRGRFESALERYADAAVAAGTNPGQGNPLLWEIPLRLAHLYEGWGRSKQAHDFAEQALLSADDQADRVGRLESHESLCRLASMAKKWDRMRLHAEAALEIALELPDRRRAARAAIEAAHALHRLGTKNQARKRALFARELSLTVGDEQTSRRATNFLARLEKK